MNFTRTLYSRVFFAFRVLAVGAFLWSPIVAHAFDPPVDLLTLNIEEFESSYGVRLSEGWMLKNGTFTYFGTQVAYEVGVNKRDYTDAYVRFFRPDGRTDLFIELFRDFLRHYASRAALIQPYYFHNLDAPQPSWDLYVPHARPSFIYQYLDPAEGFIGFGIGTRSGRPPLESSDEILRSRYYNPQFSYRDITTFDPATSGRELRAYIQTSVAYNELEIDGSEIAFDEYGIDSRTWWIKATEGGYGDNYAVEIETAEQVRGVAVQIGWQTLPLDQIQAGLIKEVWLPPWEFTPVRIVRLSSRSEVYNATPSFSLTIRPKETNEN